MESMNTTASAPCIKFYVTYSGFHAGFYVKGDDMLVLTQKPSRGSGGLLPQKILFFKTFETAIYDQYR